MKRSVKRPVSLDTPSFQYGVYLAATVAADYDKTNTHPYLVSDCILAKLNVIKGKPRVNEDALKVSKILTDIEAKIDSIAGMSRFLMGVAGIRIVRGKVIS